MNSDLGPVPGPTVAEMLAAYRTGASTPTATVEAFSTAVAARGDDGTWITVVARSELLAAAAALEARPDAVSLPLYGIPFGVKDSIDVAGYPTTLACPDYAYTPDSTAPAVQALVDAGAIFVGKTSLDQFATGLNGTRTPHPIPRSVYGNDMISGGSSSGSALAVALGQVPFCVATDTAGSGRVPAALNGIVGYKPSRGLISTVGLVPACKSLDCITLMATTVEDLDLVFDVMCAEDPADGWSRRRGEKFDGHEVTVGLPDLQQLDFSATQPCSMHIRSRAGRFPSMDYGPPQSISLRFSMPVRCCIRDRGSPSGWSSSTNSSPTSPIPSFRSSARYSWVDGGTTPSTPSVPCRRCKAFALASRSSGHRWT